MYHENHWAFLLHFKYINSYNTISCLHFKLRLIHIKHHLYWSLILKFQKHILSNVQLFPLKGLNNKWWLIGQLSELTASQCWHHNWLTARHDIIGSILSTIFKSIDKSNGISINGEYVTYVYSLRWWRSFDCQFPK